jgi:DHA1 family bicyclomycin/chloramphenicol resistance-like MFS transporter
MAVTEQLAIKSRGFALLALLGALTAVGPLSLDMYLPALPALATDLHVTAPQVQLSLTACLVGLALGQLFAGPLSDRWGRRRPVIAGALAYTAVTLLCALAPSAELLTAARFAQGLAGGVGVVVARAVVRDLYAGVAAAKYFSRLVLVFGLAPIIAPSIGSGVLYFADWRGVFVVLAVIGAVIALATAVRLPETLPAERRTTGGLREIAGSGRRLVTDRIFIGYALTQGLAFAGLFAYIAGSSFVVQEVYAASSTLFGLLFGLNALGLVALGQINARLLDRFSPRRLLVTTLGVGVLGGLALTGAATGHSLFLFAAAMFVYVASIGLVMPNGTALALDRHPSIAGTASAVLGAIQSLIGSLAAPIVGLLGGGHAAMPMAAVIAACALLALCAILLVARPPKDVVPSL